MGVFNDAVVSCLHPCSFVMFLSLLHVCMTQSDRATDIA